MYVMRSVTTPEAAGGSLLFHGGSAHQLVPAVALNAMPKLHVATVHNDCSGPSPFASIGCSSVIEDTLPHWCCRDLVVSTVTLAVMLPNRP